MTRRISAETDPAPFCGAGLIFIVDYVEKGDCRGIRIQRWTGFHCPVLPLICLQRSAISKSILPSYNQFAWTSH